MTNRLTKPKPDPAIRKEAMRARRSAPLAKRLQGIVVATSVAATLMGWALFSQQDAQAIAAQQVESSSAAASVQPPASALPTPLVTMFETGNAGQAISANAAQSFVTTPVPASVR